MTTLTRPRRARAKALPRPGADRGRARGLPARMRDVAVGLGTVQLLLDVGSLDTAREALRAVCDELQALRRSHERRV
jgi:hypothetical protein